MWFPSLLLNVSESKRRVKNDETHQWSKYTTDWAVEIMEGGEEMAEHIAQRYGFNNVGKVSVTSKLFSCLGIMLFVQ